MNEVSATQEYLDLLKGVLTRSILPEHYERLRHPTKAPYKALYPYLDRLLARKQLAIVRRVEFDAACRAEGKDWPSDAETMIGLHRLNNLQFCIEDVIRRGVPGDLIETGVWRGGAAIFMRAVLKVYGDSSRRIWLADSFQGLPRPNPEEYPADADCKFWTNEELAISVEDVRRNFERYGLLDNQVRFLIGWFKDTLPTAPIERLAVLRLDGDMYESTIQALDALYPKLARGGFCIIDDHYIPACRQAVTDYRARHDITDEILPIDWTGVFWQRG